MKKAKTIISKAVFVKIGKETVGRLRGRQKIRLIRKNKGRLRDGRIVVKRKKRWYYIPK